MAYTVLARRYRSQTFDDVVGQDAIAQTLRNAIKTGRIAHAFLFSGTRGVGKTTMARILAKSLNCQSSEGPTTTPCCKCDSCVSVNTGEDVDVIEIDGASNNGVDNVRELRQNAIYRPARSRFKIYIIDEVHMLSSGAFNALLKILEEPPTHVKFIFATTEPNKVLPTIQSRCQRFDFVNISAANIVKQLQMVLESEHIKYEEDVALAVAKLADGSMRDALSLLDQMLSTGIEPLSMAVLEEYLGQPSSSKIAELAGRIADHEAAGVLETIDSLLTGGLSAPQVAIALIDFMRDLMVVKSAGAKSNLVVLTATQREQASALAGKFDIAALIYSITTLEKLRYGIKNSDSPRALLEAALLRLALSEHFINLDELASGQGGGDVKKKLVTNTAVPAPAMTRESYVSAVAKPAVPVSNSKANISDIESLKEQWKSLLEQIGAAQGNSIAGLLASAVPATLEGNVLVLQFGASSKFLKEMCESGPKADQIRKILSDIIGRPIMVKYELGSEVTKPPGAQTSREQREEVMNDPAVKSLLTELRARVTGIDEA